MTGQRRISEAELHALIDGELRDLNEAIRAR
jgi:anti-sigma factor RsiW